MLRLLTKARPLGPETTDETLVRLAQAGESQAFKALFERHVTSVRRFLMDLLRDRSAADDATQESFARAHAQLIKLTQGTGFKPWVLGIARNVAYETRRLKLHDSWDSGEDEGVPDAVIPSPDPEKLLLDQELEGQFNAALDQLSPLRRAALALRLEQGLSYEEIAETMGWSLPTVKNELHRARLKLRSLLLPHVGGAL